MLVGQDHAPLADGRQRVQIIARQFRLVPQPSLTCRTDVTVRRIGSGLGRTPPLSSLLPSVALAFFPIGVLATPTRTSDGVGGTCATPVTSSSCPLCSLRRSWRTSFGPSSTNSEARKVSETVTADEECGIKRVP
jgi:hypothetical protein